MELILLNKVTNLGNLGDKVRVKPGYGRNYLVPQGLAASAFVPVMVLGIFWRGTTRQGAVAGMLAGLGIAVYYMLSHVPVLRTWAGWLLADGLWFGIQPISAGVFGVPAGLIVAVVVSRITRPAPALPLVRSEM